MGFVLCLRIRRERRLCRDDGGGGDGRWWCDGSRMRELLAEGGGGGGVHETWWGRGYKRSLGLWNRSSCTAAEMTTSKDNDRD